MKENKKIKVLLVDDEETFARTLSERLEARDVAADAVFSGQEALDSIEGDEPDVMVLDLKMPGMDGMEVLRKVKERYPNIQTIILSGHGTEGDRERAAELGAFDFIAKPLDITSLHGKISQAFAVKGHARELYTYADFVSFLQRTLDREGVSLGENALGIKCFCRDDNQDRLGSLIAGVGKSSGWFDLNAFGAYPAGRSVESLGPPSHHIPEVKETQWTVVLHATHVGCDSQYTLGLTDRYGMQKPGSSCGLLAGVLARHKDRKAGKVLRDLSDFEMNEVEKALLPHLEEISSSPYPMAAAAEKLLGLGSLVFDSLLRESRLKAVYIGGINVDYDAENPENNFFVPKTASIYEGERKREIILD